MGIRDDLADLLALQDITGGFAGSARKLREQAAQRQLNEQLPELIAQGQFGEIAGQAGTAGIQTLQTGVVEKLMAGQLKASAPGAQKLTRDQIIAYLPEDSKNNEELIVSLEQSPLTVQNQMIKNDQIRFNQLQNRNVSIANLGERKSQAIQGQRGAASKVIDETLKPYEDDDKNLTKIKAAFNKNSNTGDSLAMVYIAKVIGGQSGVLTDKDIDRMLGPSFQMKANELKNYLSGGNETILTPAQRQSLREVIQLAEQNNTTFRARDVQKTLQDAINSNPRLIDKNGNVDSAIKSRAEREGYSVSVDPDGQVILGTGKKKTSITQPSAASVEGQGMDVAGLAKKISDIKDPKRKKQASEELQRFNKRTISKEQYDRFNSILDQVLGGQ